jgi:hypothetical protein
MTQRLASELDALARETAWSQEIDLVSAEPETGVVNPA